MSGDRILVIEDEAPIRRFLRIAVESAGYVLIEADRGRTGIERAATEAPDCIVLDLGLPDMDGKSVIAWAVREWSKTPILVLSVRDGEAEKIAALDAGADDYVTKPFATGELLARLRALLRARKPAEEQAVLHFGDSTIDIPAHTVSRGGVDAKLTRKEFDVLSMLARNAGRLLTHRQLLAAVWGPAHTEDAHYLRIAIGHIREKIGEDAAYPRFILTEPGVGYRLLGS